MEDKESTSIDIDKVSEEDVIKAKKKRKKKSKVKVSYVKPQPIKKQYLNLEVHKLKENMIETGDLKYVYTKEDKEIEIKHSWIELCLLLLGNIHINNKDKFIRILLDYKILSNEFNVTATREFYIDETDKKEYKIPASQFWLITNMNCRVIKKAIINMCTALDILDNLKLDIVPTGERINKISVSGEYSVEGLYKSLDDTISINNIRILGISYQVSSPEGAIMVLLQVIKGLYGDEVLYSLMTCNTKNIGIVDNKDTVCMEIYDLNEENYTGKRYYLYNNKNIKDSIKFIDNIVKRLEIGYENITIGIVV